MSFDEEGIRVKLNPELLPQDVKKTQDNYKAIYVYLNSGAVVHFKCSEYQVGISKEGIDRFVYDNPEPKVFFDLSSIEAIVER